MRLIVERVTGSALEGTAGYTSCLNGLGGGGRFTGTRNGNNVSIAIVNGATVVECDLVLSASSITGTYSVVSNVCDDAIGGAGTVGQILCCRVNPLDVTGTWDGFWDPPPGNKPVVAHLTQVGNAITGTFEFTDNPCVTAGTINATLTYTDVGQTSAEFIGLLDAGAEQPFTIGGQAQFRTMGLGHSGCGNSFALYRRSLPCGTQPREGFSWQMRQTIYVFEEPAAAKTR